jgi:hypothetical protein
LRQLLDKRRTLGTTGITFLSFREQLLELVEDQDWHRYRRFPGILPAVKVLPERSTLRRRQ